MSHAMVLPPPMTIEAFDAFLLVQRDEVKWELLEGRPVAMTNPTLRHAEIVGNVGAALRSAMPPDRSCRVTSGDVRVQIADDVHDIYAPVPDLMVWCGPMRGERNFVTTPQIIIEVLSPSAMDHDRGPKLRFYKTSLPTLRHLALVYQDQMRIEVYHRTDLGWAPETLTRPDGMLRLHALMFELTLADVYAGVDFDAA